METIYLNPKHPAAFTGLENLWRAVRSEGGKKKKEVKQWLTSQTPYTLHKPVRKNFPRNKIEVPSKDYQFELDLADLKSLTKFNDGYRYILVVIDVLSKYAWAVPLKTKTGEEVTKAFESILESSGRYPQVVRSDSGKEFLNSTFQKFLQDNYIDFYPAMGDHKASIAERFIRTLKTRLYKFFTHTQKYRFLEVLPDIVKGYNNSYHRTIKTTPASVTDKNQQTVWETMYGNDEEPRIVKHAFKEGDLVRISQLKSAFRKAHEVGWSREIFQVKTVVDRQPPVYILHDLTGERIQGTFYKEELQKVPKIDDPETLHPIEKVLKKRTQGNQEEYFVKWQGYPVKFNSWIPASHITDL